MVAIPVRVFARNKTLRGLSTPSLAVTVYERHSHHTAFHSTAGSLPEMCDKAAHAGIPSVPFQQRHAHQTYTVPQSAM
jgi:hypothetical protein